MNELRLAIATTTLGCAYLVVYDAPQHIERVWPIALIDETHRPESENEQRWNGEAI